MFAVIPAQIGDGLRDSWRAGVVLGEILHETAVLFIVLKKLKGLGGSEDSLLVGLGVRRGNLSKNHDALRDKALVHECVAKQDAGLAVFRLAGEFLKVVMEFVDRGAIAFELLRAIGFAEDGRAPVQALGMVLQVGIHEFAAFLELLVERVAHAEPVGAAVGEAVFRISRQEVFECLCGVGVFFRLE